MIKLVIYLARMLTSRIRANSSSHHQSEFPWHRDPLAHPAVHRMSERELADLPFERGYIRSPREDG